MSGGYVGIEVGSTNQVKPLGANEHQVIVVTIKGPVTQAVMDEWNDFMKQIKPKFAGNMIAVTIDGADTPRKFRGP
jgi:hypothetical protein